VPPRPPDPEAATKAQAGVEKRVQAREAKVTAGLRDLEMWLQDLVRSGFATLPGRPSSFWERPAARLVDAQARAVARRVRDLDGIHSWGEAWPRRLLEKLAQMHLICEGWKHAGTLPPPLKADLHTAIGFTEKQEEILAQSGLRDRWLVLGQRIEEEEVLRIQRTWLFGADSGRAALSLSFAPGNQPFDKSLLPGTMLDAELVFFPGTLSLRALVKQRHGAPSQIDKPGKLPHADISAANKFASECFAANPWLERVPFGLAAIYPLRRQEKWLVRDAAGNMLSLQCRDEHGWRLLSLSGGHPVALFGEWDGEALRPLSVWAEGRFLSAFLQQ